MASMTLNAPQQRGEQVWQQLLQRLPADVAINGLLDDHRRLLPEQRGMIFAAMPGARFDPRAHLAEIMAKQPLALLLENQDGWSIPAEIQQRSATQGIALILVPHLQEVVGMVAHHAYGQPSSRMQVVGVTGTNGKTSIAWALSQLLTRLGQPCGMIGTLGCGLPDALVDSGMTTPSAAEFHRYLAQIADLGGVAAACEVTSIALTQARAAGCQFFSALFSNLSRDHLDHHGTLQAYAEAKSRLFQDFPLSHALINVDDAYGEVLMARVLPRLPHTWGIRQGVDREVHVHTWQWRGQSPTAFTVNAPIAAMDLHGLDAAWQKGAKAFSAPWLGRHNIENLAQVVVNLALMGFAADAIQAALHDLPPPPGRLQAVRTALDDAPLPSVWVDFAHTPDALEKALHVLREEANRRGGRLWCVFGCGGNRDRGKRPLMGELAERLADGVVVTSDNPRHEDPTTIIHDIYPKPSGKVLIEVLRDRAIHTAINAAATEDVVLIAGKGHEPYQEINGEKRPFSDEAQAQHALQQRSRA